MMVVVGYDINVYSKVKKRFTFDGGGSRESETETE